MKAKKNLSKLSAPSYLDGGCDTIHLNRTAWRDLAKSPKPPLFLQPVRAGFPNPANDSVEMSLDLNSYIVAHPEATYFVRAAGDSMEGLGIHDGDILVVDRSLEYKNGSVVIAMVDGEFTVKTLSKKGDEVHLISANPNFPPMKITGELEIWGVVTYVIHKI